MPYNKDLDLDLGNVAPSNLPATAKVIEILSEISAEPGSNRKMEILESHKQNFILKRALYLTNSKRVKFYIKQIPDYVTGNITMNLETAMNELSVLSNRTVTGHDASKHLSKILSSVAKDDAIIIERIIEKDAKIGMGSTNINKIFSGLIEDTPYMGAKSFSEKLARDIFTMSNYAYSQIKMDGRYANAIVRNGEVELESRGGEPTTVEGAKFLSELSKFDDCVLNGEITIDGVTRYESNGIVASLVSIGGKKKAGESIHQEVAKFEKENNMSYRTALDSLRYTVWDTITVDEYFDKKSDVIYHDRLINLSALLKKANPTMVSFIRTKKVYSYEEAINDFQYVLGKGEEGTILKASNGTWKDGKPNWQVKMKLEMDVDLIISGFNYGTGKNANVISSLNAKSSDGLVFTRPTGIKEDMMKFITDNQAKLLGTVVEVKCSGLSHDSSGNYSLLHPVFKKIRDDKTTCDSLDSIKEIEAMAKGLTKTK